MTAPLTITLEKLDRLVAVLKEFPELGPFSNKDALLELLKTELKEGCAAPKFILHVVSANTPMAGMQSLIRGLLLGSRNGLKLPSAGLPRLEEFVAKLPGELAGMVEISHELPHRWLDEADAVIVFGSDETVEMFRGRCRSEQIFAGYGNRWSGAVVFSDPEGSLPQLLEDVCLYDQLGCLSAQIIWVDENSQPRLFAENLAQALADRNALQPFRKPGMEESMSIERWRQHFAWKAAVGQATKIWSSPESATWTVVFDATVEVTLTPLYRSVLIKPFTGVPQVGPLSESLSSLGIWPFTPENRQMCQSLGASRLCPVGQMQFPHPTWQQDGFPAIGRLLRAG